MKQVYIYDKETGELLGEIFADDSIDLVLDPNEGHTEQSLPVYDKHKEFITFSGESNAWQIKQKTIPFADETEAAKSEIDRAAALTLKQKITSHMAQMGIYEMKLSEANSFKNSGYLTDLVNFPLLSMESQARGISAKEVADDIILKHNECSNFIVTVEDIRIKNKQKLDDISFDMLSVEEALEKIWQIEKNALVEFYQLTSTP
jgi:hypothetical protein